MFINARRKSSPIRDRAPCVCRAPGASVSESPGHVRSAAVSSIRATLAEYGLYSEARA